MRCVVLILAAGAASRFGAPKALAPWRGGTLLSHAVGTASRAGQPVVVLGGYAPATSAALTDTLVIFNPDWADGLGTSIACGAVGALAAWPDSDALVILPVDQPLVTAAHLVTLSEAALKNGKCAFTRDNAIWGPPASIPAAFFPHLKALKKDQGLKAVISAADCIYCEAPGMLADIDTPEDLARLQ